MNRRIFLNLLPAAGALFGLKAKAKPLGPNGQMNRIKWASFLEHDGQRASDLAFYSGDQWPARIRGEREKAGRPCVVFNRLPLIVAQIAAGQNLTHEELEALILETVRKGRDYQTVLNYCMSERLSRGQGRTREMEREARSFLHCMAVTKRYPPAERTHEE